ncbi:hypothetical protein [Kitasatospora sp. CB01950]|uniref:hypothetical protein n=1 Tax=Kitasatospora sp. CB01950 TaxID=1703930 RepID=UPI00093B3601|nr:hypothetical protein [Kitasatospora sp. CB01950]OKJ10201.1 hypothetical protein AMK19_15010 [Kitasatospora sp. CB01950]
MADAALRLTGRGALSGADGQQLDGATVTPVAADPALRRHLLDEGRWPGAPDEVPLDTAHRLDVTPDSNVRLHRADGTTVTAHLVGTLDGGGAPSLAGHPILRVPDSAVEQCAAAVTAAQLDVRLQPGPPARTPPRPCAPPSATAPRSAPGRRP